MHGICKSRMDGELYLSMGDAAPSEGDTVVNSPTREFFIERRAVPHLRAILGDGLSDSDRAILDAVAELRKALDDGRLLELRVVLTTEQRRLDGTPGHVDFGGGAEWPTLEAARYMKMLTPPPPALPDVETMSIEAVRRELTSRGWVWGKCEVAPWWIWASDGGYIGANEGEVRWDFDRRALKQAREQAH